MTQELEPSSRGTLFPETLPPRFRRVPADVSMQTLVSWWWMSEWSLSAGEVSVQRLLAFPASNLAVETDMVGLAGPTTRASERRLEARGWVVGALLKPAALAALHTAPTATRDTYAELDEPELHAAVRCHAPNELEAAIPAVAKWLEERCGEPSDEALMANRMVELAGGDPAVVTVADLARALHVSDRTVHRLAERYVGLTPYAIIRRRRLQEAAQCIRDTRLSLTDIATSHGFPDQVHLTREFHRILGVSPGTYREAVKRTARHD